MVTDKRMANRRTFLQRAGGAALAFAVPAEALTGAADVPSSPQGGDGSGLLTDTRYAEGAAFRLREFVNRGADAKASEEIFRRLTSLDAEPWAAAWSELGARAEESGDQLERQGKKKEAGDAYNEAVLYYGVAKFPVLN